MKRSRVRVGLAVGFVGLVLATGTAAAQVEGCDFSVCEEQELEVTTPRGDGDELGAGEENQPGGDVGAPGGGEVGPDEAVSPEVVESETVGAPAQAAPSGTLPFTGNDVVGLVVLGAAAVGAGALLLRRSRATA